MELPTRNVKGAFVTAEYFSKRIIPIYLGRMIQPYDEGVAILTYGLWRTLYSSDLTVIGQKVNIDDESYTVVSITDPHLDSAGIDLWIVAKSRLVAYFTCPNFGVHLT